MGFYDLLALDNTNMYQSQWRKEQRQEEDRKTRKRNKKKMRGEKREGKEITTTTKKGIGWHSS